MIHAHRLPAHDIADVHHHVHVGRPGLELPLPGGECGQRHHNQERPVELVVVEQVGQEGDSLDGLPQPHLISQDNTVAPAQDAATHILVYHLPLLLPVSYLADTCIQSDLQKHSYIWRRGEGGGGGVRHLVQYRLTHSQKV